MTKRIKNPFTDMTPFLDEAFARGEEEDASWEKADALRSRGAILLVRIDADPELLRQVVSSSLLNMTSAKERISPEEFLAVLEGRDMRSWPNQAYCTARLFDYHKLHELTEVFDRERLLDLWPSCRLYVQLEDDREDMDRLWKSERAAALGLEDPRGGRRETGVMM